jgi:hypothetical protein
LYIESLLAISTLTLPMDRSLRENFLNAEEACALADGLKSNGVESAK